MVVASLGFAQGVINTQIFSVIILITVFTTGITPILLKMSYKWIDRAAQPIRVISEEVTQPVLVVGEHAMDLSGD